LLSNFVILRLITTHRLRLWGRSSALRPERRPCWETQYRWAAACIS